MNIFEYIKKYGDLSFNENIFNEVDNIIFSTLLYLNFDTVDDTIENIGKTYLKNNKYKDIKKLGMAQGGAYKLLEKVVDKKRYKDIKIVDYVFEYDKDKQFKAATFIIDKYLNYIGFEGTDELVSGWKEDCLFACTFPVPSHIETINYMNKHIKLFGPNVIVGGHSKGGHLALIGSMYVKPYKQFKIKQIYNNDGPGLRYKELNSYKYRKIKGRYTHFIADYSIVGVLLRDENKNIIKSSKKNILSHDATTWLIEDNKFINSKLSLRSKRFQQSVLSWLDKHSYQERTDMINNIFKVLEDNNIDTLNKAIKFNNIIKIIRGIKNIDRDTKNLMINLIISVFKETNAL